MSTASESGDRIGSIVGGKYVLRSVLGSGGMGAVYAAENTWTRRPVALKLLHPELTRNREVVERFMQEAQFASQLRHPNIVDVLDMGREASDGSLFIVQELLRGNDLRAMLDASGRIDPASAVDIALPLMGALALAHLRGVVHRDIKPENIFLAIDEAGEVVPKLIDFGISKLFSDAPGDRALTQVGALVGTPDYMSPEQARGDGTLDAQTDVWSLGVVLYEMLCGRAPFDAPTQNLLLVQLITETPPRIESFAPDVPPALAAIVHRAVERERDARFRDTLEFADAVLCSGLFGPEFYERHRRSLGVSPEAAARLQGIARARVVVPQSTASPATPSSYHLDGDNLASAAIQPPANFATPLAPLPSVNTPTTAETPVEWIRSDGQVVATSPVRSRWVPPAAVATLALVTTAAVLWLRPPPPRPSLAAVAPTPITLVPTVAAAPPSAEVPATPIPTSIDAAVAAAPPATRTTATAVRPATTPRPTPRMVPTLLPPRMVPTILPPRPVRRTSSRPSQNGAPILD